MRITNIILILIYLFSGTVLSGFGRISIQAENSISRKSSTPKTHYLSNVRLQKHIIPAAQNESAVDAETVSELFLKITHPSFIAGIPPCDFYSSPGLFNNLSNKAPPSFRIL